jgi:hypothetical protein
MTVPKLHRAAVTAALALALGTPGGEARAQTVALAHTQSFYADEKNVALKAPEGVACREGVAVVSDTGNRRLLRFTITNGALVGATEVKVAQVPSPGRVQLDSKGNILVLDQKSRKIARLDPKGAFVSFVEPRGAKGGPVVPEAFKLDASDALFVLDGAGKRVLALDGSGTVTREVALPASDGVFTDFAVEAGGRLYAVDGVNATVWAADAGATEFKPLSKSLKDNMNFPAYVQARSGALLVLDQYGHGLVTVGTDGTYRGRQLGMGWGEGLVYYPAQLCANETELLVADRYNNRVQVFAFR